MKTSFILPCCPLYPPNKTALLSSTAVKLRAEHGGGRSPVVAGHLHTPAVETEEIVFTYSSTELSIKDNDQ